jgi:predicted kinase
MKRLILLIGLPGSGKTTLAKKLVERGFQSISADTIRKDLYGDEAEQGDPEKVFAIFFEQLDQMLSNGADIVVDNTNLKAKHRKEITDRAQPFGYEDTQLWLIDVPLAQCLERNRLRPRKVGDDIVANMYMEFNRSGRPKRHEGKLVLIRPGKDENDFRFFFPERKQD